MPAADHLNSTQLSMFMYPHELARLNFADNEGDNSSRAKNALLHSKLVEGHAKLKTKHGAGVAPSVKASGVQEPVAIMHGDPDLGVFLNDGHHRLAAALAYRPNQLVPVEHVDPENYDSLRYYQRPPRGPETR